jgi:2-polyprenyl-6-methoxyphenol hydroxylase-like FAD-dependent oxidoreductase
MEETPVVIVGAGPAGLVLALSLARYEIHVRKVNLIFIAKNISKYTT